MAVTREILLAKLQGLGIQFETVEHAAVSTVEAQQVQALKETDGIVCKSLLLKDKKRRLYLVCAAADTRVDLKVLGVRLGLPKPGVSFAPEDMLQSILQVPPGSATPLALVQPTATRVALLLDHKLQEAPRVLMHPLTNTVSVMMSGQELGTFLRSIEREPEYVDLEDCPAIDAQHPPDLRQYVPEAASGAPESEQ
eukprot:jgi/Astpho2/9366/gw1.00145.102.1_t